MSSSDCRCSPAWDVTLLSAEVWAAIQQLDAWMPSRLRMTLGGSVDGHFPGIGIGKLLILHFHPWFFDFGTFVFKNETQLHRLNDIANDLVLSVPAD